MARREHVVARALLGALLGLGAPAGVHAEQAVPPADASAVRLRYAWPVGLSARVEVTRTREREAEGTRDLTESRARFRMRVEPYAEGARVLHEAFELPGATADRSPGQLQYDLRSFFPSFLVTAEGRFGNVEPLTRTRVELLKLLRRLQLAGPEAERMLQPIVSRPRMLAASADHWRTLVRLWRDQGFEPGRVYDVEDAQVLPLFGGLPMPAVFHTVLRRRTACEPGGSALDCVELEMTSEPTPDGEASMRAQLAARPDARIEGRPVRSARLETGVLLVAEPGSLIPHQLTTLRIVTQTVDGLGLLRLVEKAAYEFHYERRVPAVPAAPAAPSEPTEPSAAGAPD